ncbi:hypothetical protein U472_10630 [Orenia metallireducens]|uniref:Outer membrane efflux protein n=1 Tax=Orenia metallireducens TaxID=1413210 RepID=A0A1C0A898_9FIRM|nr:hypothetical protein [Orenia metallireducens]OCL26448.1 hypothetical protein U472_10630 [Orenia metallireducens]
MKLSKQIKGLILLLIMVFVISISVFADSTERIDKFEAVKIAKLELDNTEINYQRSQAENLVNQYDKK